MNTLAFLKSLKDAPGEIRSYRHGNQSGTLWEKLWKFDGDRFWSKTCASGCFVDWYDYPTEVAALRSMEGDLEIMRMDR